MRLPSSLQWRIALAYTILIVLSMAAASIYIFIFVRGTYISDLEVRLEHEAALTGQTAERFFRNRLSPEDLQAESRRIGDLIDARVTVISQDGSVLSDTWEAPTAMGNQSGRPEVQAALADGLGRSTRLNAATGQNMLHTAVPVYVDGSLVGIARVAVPTSQVQGNVNSLIAAVAIAGLSVTLLSVVLGYFLVRRTSRSLRSVTDGARRLAQGDLEHRVYAPVGDETQELADTFNMMAANLRTTIQELAAERNKLSAILETMADGVVMIGPEGEVLLINQVARSLLDVDRTDTLGRRFIELSRDYEIQLMVSKSFESGQPQYGEVQLPHRRFVSVIAIPLVDNESSPGVLLTLYDLTRVRQLDTTRREFVSNVSHELRNPLASIKAAVETLEDGAIGEPDIAKDFVRRIHGDVDRMIGMSGELLELSRLESGQVPLHLYPLDVRPLLEDVRLTFAERANAKGVGINVSSNGDIPLVMGDEEKLRQVLVNLLDNALKFTPQQGEVTLTAAEKGDVVEVRVGDTGAGIPGEHLPHVFERFYKVDRSRRDGGTGLGLAIVKHIVQLHGGDVQVESQEGLGSAFSFTVPRAG